MRILAKMAKRFVAGESIEDIIPVVQSMNNKGLMSSLDLLGEDVSHEQNVTDAKQLYFKLIDTIVAKKLNSNISLKLTQMGLDLDDKLCLTTVEDIVSCAAQHNIFVRVDMESTKHTQETIDMVTRLRQSYQNIGIVIQAYLHRSLTDIKNLGLAQTAVRVCKGAYKESNEVALQKMPKIRELFIELCKEHFKNQSPLAIATHDIELIEWAKQWTQQNNVAKDAFEFQFLYGMRRKLSQDLANQGYKVRIYVPFGSQWLPYFIRRLKERKENIWFVIKSLFTD